MQITKMTLSLFLDHFKEKIFNKKWGGINLIFDIFTQYIWVSDFHLWVLTDLLGGDQPFFRLTIFKSKEGEHQPKQILLSKRMVTIHRG